MGEWQHLLTSKCPELRGDPEDLQGDPLVRKDCYRDVGQD